MQGANVRLDAVLARPGVKRLLDVMNGHGEETRIVGGAVRNALMNRPVRDIDCATTALPQEIIRRAKKAGFKPVPTGIEHGTITVVIDRAPFEVTTLREDVETNGRHAVVRFGRDFTTDALRRDFTINALLLDKDGVVHDLVGGMPDLEAGLVRFIGEPERRIAEDYLRILRFFRFHADYGAGKIDAAGFRAAIAGRDGLEQLSRERVRSEILKLLSARRSAEVCTLFAQTSMLMGLLGGVMELGRLERATIAGLDPIYRLAALAVRVREDADRLRERLRLSNVEYKALADYAVVLEHLGVIKTPLEAIDIDRLAYRFGLAATLNALSILDQPAYCAMSDDARSHHEDLANGLSAIPIFPLSGRHLIEAGLATGPKLGSALAQAETLWLDAGMPTDSTALSDIIQRVIKA
jgi:poly(A) polymerase